MLQVTLNFMATSYLGISSVGLANATGGRDRCTTTHSDAQVDRAKIEAKPGDARWNAIGGRAVIDPRLRSPTAPAIQRSWMLRRISSCNSHLLTPPASRYRRSS